MSDDFITVRIDPALAVLVPKFLARCRRTVTEFQGAVQSHDFVVARRIGHALFGTASSYGFHELAVIGKEIEQAARSGDSAALQELADRLDAHLARVRPAFD
jgi:HPt (histidine-containing phosphotransfer) domain-containing protein